MRGALADLIDQSIWNDEVDFRAAVDRWAMTIRVTPRVVRLQSMRRKWASCSPSGIVTFSRDLLSLNRSFGEAVIVHELVHLTVRNHGKLFRSMVQSFTNGRLPDVSEYRSEVSDPATSEAHG
jgi:predicted metal-dependent hydrolase